MNTNFDTLFEQTKAASNEKNKLLLHVCCAPCATYCLTRVLDVFDVTLFYSNDNITDAAEWQKRLGEIEKLVDIVNRGQFEVQPKHKLKLVVPEHNPMAFFEAAKGLESEKEGGARCLRCFEFRLASTQKYALENGFDLFGTTLTVSPYKNSRILNQTGLALETENLRWLPSDFKKKGGYDESIRLSQKYELYRQHYCGCEFSLLQQLQQNK